MMPAKRPKTRRDLNQLAKRLVDIAVGDAKGEKPEPTVARWAAIPAPRA